MSIENTAPNPFSREAHEARVAAQNAPGNVMEAYGNQPDDVEIDDMKQMHGAGETVTVPDFAVERTPAEVETARDLGATGFEAEAIALGDESNIDGNGRTKISLVELKAMQAARGDIDVTYHAKQQDKPPLTRVEIDRLSDGMTKQKVEEDLRAPEAVEKPLSAKSEVDSIEVIEIKRAIQEYASLMYAAKRSEEINGYNADSDQNRRDAQARISMLPTRYRELAARYYKEEQI